MERADDIEDLSNSGTDSETFLAAAKAEWKMCGYTALFPRVMYKIICTCKFVLELNPCGSNIYLLNKSSWLASLMAKRFRNAVQTDNSCTNSV